VTPLSMNSTPSPYAIQTASTNSNTATVTPNDGSSTSNTPAPRKSNGAFPRGNTQAGLWGALGLVGGMLLA
jgi:hypothetical protein